MKRVALSAAALVTAGALSVAVFGLMRSDDSGQRCFVQDGDAAIAACTEAIQSCRFSGDLIDLEAYSPVVDYKADHAAVANEMMTFTDGQYTVRARSNWSRGVVTPKEHNLAARRRWRLRKVCAGSA